MIESLCVFYMQVHKSCSVWPVCITKLKQIITDTSIPQLSTISTSTFPTSINPLRCDLHTPAFPLLSLPPNKGDCWFECLFWLMIFIVCPVWCNPHPIYLATGARRIVNMLPKWPDNNKHHLTKQETLSHYYRWQRINKTCAVRGYIYFYRWISLGLANN